MEIGLEGVISVPARRSVFPMLRERLFPTASSAEGDGVAVLSPEVFAPIVGTPVACSTFISVLATALGAGPRPRKAKLIDREIRGLDRRVGDLIIDFLAELEWLDAVGLAAGALWDSLRSRIEVS